MLRNKSIQGELKAVPEQARKLDALYQDLLTKGQKEVAQIRNLPPDQRGPKIQAMQRAQQDDLHKGLAEILKPEQVKRFEQIDVQQAGIAAFEIPRVREALRLTAGQKAQFQAIDREWRASLRAAGGDFQKDPKAAVAKSLAVRVERWRSASPC